MKNEMQMVREFRKAFALPVSEALKLPTPDQLELHREMIVDEADGEIGCAATTDDVRDVCVDLIYFVLGLAAESGITAEQLEEDFEMVHQANMRKLWTIDQVNEFFKCSRFAIKAKSRSLPAGNRQRCGRLGVGSEQ